MTVRLQREDFDANAEAAALTRGRTDIARTPDIAHGKDGGDARCQCGDRRRCRQQRLQWAPARR